MVLPSSNQPQSANAIGEPFSLTQLTFASADSRERAMFTSPRWAATCKDVKPLLSSAAEKMHSEGPHQNLCSLCFCLNVWTLHRWKDSRGKDSRGAYKGSWFPCARCFPACTCPFCQPLQRTTSQTFMNEPGSTSVLFAFHSKSSSTRDKGRRIVLNFFDKVWDLFGDFFPGTICLVFATVWN